MVLKTTPTLHVYFNGFLCRDRRTGYEGIEGKKDLLRLNFRNFDFSYSINYGPKVP